MPALCVGAPFAERQSDQTSKINHSYEKSPADSVRNSEKTASAHVGAVFLFVMRAHRKLSFRSCRILPPHAPASRQTDRSRRASRTISGGHEGCEVSHACQH